MEHQGITLWFTGLSGAGKTTISDLLYEALKKSGYRVEQLDGDIIRTNLSKGLTFSREDRDTNVKRIGFVANLLTRNGVIVLVSAISPYRSVRNEVREHIGNFIEIYVNAPLSVCEERDVKGLYKKAKAGEISHFTGVNDPYEPPDQPDVECKTNIETPEQCVQKIMKIMRELGYIHCDLEQELENTL